MSDPRPTYTAGDVLRLFPDLEQNDIVRVKGVKTRLYTLKFDASVVFTDRQRRSLPGGSGFRTGQTVERRARGRKIEKGLQFEKGRWTRTEFVTLEGALNYLDSLNPRVERVVRASVFGKIWELGKSPPKWYETDERGWREVLPGTDVRTAQESPLRTDDVPKPDVWAISVRWLERDETIANIKPKKRS